MKKGLLFSGLILLIAGVVLSGVGRSMGGSTTATAHFFGQNINLYCSLPALSINPGWRHAESMPIDQVTVWTSDDPQPAYSAEAEYATVIEGSASDGWYGSETNLAPFESIEVDLDLGDVSVIGADFYGIYFESSDADYRICYENVDNTLKIWDEANVDMFKGFTSDVTVYVPEGVLLDNLNVDVDMGDVNLYLCRAREAEITLELGDLYATDFYTDGRLDVESSLGDVELWGGFNGTMEISNDLGDVCVGGDLTGSLNIDADMGDVVLYLSGNKSDYCWSLEVDMGDIWVDSNSNSNGHLSGGSGRNVIDVSAEIGTINVSFNC